MAGRFLGLSKVFRGKRKNGPGAAPAQEPEEVEQFKPLQDDAATDRTPAQEPARGLFRRTLKMFRKFLRVRRRRTSTAAAEAELDCRVIELQAEPDGSTDLDNESEDSATAMNDHGAKADTAVPEDVVVTIINTEETQAFRHTGTTPTPTGIPAPTVDFFQTSGISYEQQVPASVRNIHQSLASHVHVDTRLPMNVVRLAIEHPADVVLTLLRCAPTCDRAAATMWRAIASSGAAMEMVLPTLLRVMEHWPRYKTCTSDGDNKDVFALAATLVLWVIVQVPQPHEVMTRASCPLFTALLRHVAITTQQMPEEVEHFWRGCQEEQRLPSNPNRFAVQAMKALLYCLQYEHLLMAMERKRGWDTMLCADTQHYAMGLLAREMRRDLNPFCSPIACHLVLKLGKEQPSWDLPLLAFLVEVLECLDLREWGYCILDTMSRYLQSGCSERRRLALRGLMVLIKEPSMARIVGLLSQRLVELLADAHGCVVSMALSVLTNIPKDEHIPTSSTTAPKLAEALLPLLDSDNTHVQLCSLSLLFKVMDEAVGEEKKPLKSIVRQSLLPLFFHCHDENRRVVMVSLNTLLRATRFLKRRKLKHLLKNGRMLKFGKCLLADDRSRAAETLRQALPYLENPQESLREVALRFIGSARVLLRGHKEALQVLNESGLAEELVFGTQ